MTRRVLVCLLSLCVAASLLLVACGGKQDTFPPESGCGDGTDDDEDGLIDCEDPDCDGAPACRSEHCYNLVDDNLDGATDCEDDQCAGVAICYERLEHCTNLLDDDGDGDADCDDPDCANTSVCLAGGEDCASTADEDADGAASCDDEDCKFTAACALSPETCDNGEDDDADGATDCDDPDCAYSSTCLDGGEVCDNQVDDDADGAADCFDPDCAHNKSCLRDGQSCTTACVSNADCATGLACYNGRCAENSCSCLECADGDVCGRGACRTACTTQDDCPTGLRCFDGACYSSNSVPNLPPTASAGQDQTVDEGVTVTLDGTATDPDGQIVNTQWTQLDGPGVTIDELGMGEAEFVAPTVTVETMLTFEFRAFDNEAGQAADEVVITVQPVTQPPVVDAGNDFEAPHNQSVTLTGSGTDDGTIVEWEWTQLSGDSVTISDADQPIASFAAPLVTESKALEFQLEATDDEGLTDTDSVVVTLVPTNSPPTVDAGNDRLVSPGENVILSGSASDPNTNDSIASVMWTQVAGPSVTLTNADQAVASFDAPTDVDCVQTLVFELQASDTVGATVSDRVSVTVVDGGRAVTVPYVEDFEQIDGGGYTTTSGWNHGAPSSGPGAAYSGGNVWATNLAGDVDRGTSILTAIPFDLRTATAPVWSFRMWVDGPQIRDALRVEVNDGSGWKALPSAVRPAYGVTAADGKEGWHSILDRGYRLATIDMSSYAGEFVCTRFVFVTDGLGPDGKGAYIDDVRLDEESSDPDGDGISGIRGEQDARNTDPFVADTDGDGAADGAEVNAQTNPLNPAVSPNSTALTPDTTLSFENGPGGLVAYPGELWEHGTPTGGPASAYSGSQLWATNLAGGHPTGNPAHVYLPPVDLTTATDPTFSFWIWTQQSVFQASQNGAALEVRTAQDAWTPIDFQVTPYNATQDGHAVWIKQSSLRTAPGTPFVLAAASLQPWVGEVIEMRVSFYRGSGRLSQGFFFDDISIIEEGSDPDADGLPGVIGEFTTYQTRPFVKDSDGDGIDDGTELNTDQTQPLNPADYKGAPTLTAPFLLTFDGADDGGLETDGISWEWGAPSSGGGAYSGGNAWATNLSGQHSASVADYLYLPAIDISGVTDPTFSFQLWTEAWFGQPDGLTVEFLDSSGTWSTLTFSSPAYQGNQFGRPIWTDITPYQLASAPLGFFTSDTVWLRFGFLADGGSAGAGSYIDDVEVN